MGLTKTLPLVILGLTICGFCQSTEARALSLDEDVEPIEDIFKRANSNMTTDDHGFLHDPAHQLILTEYDIANTENEIKSMTEIRQKRTAGVKWRRFRWTDKTVNYEVQRSHFSTDALNVIKDAMSEWSNYTCVKFQETNSARDRLKIEWGSGCFTQVGMRGYVQTLSLGLGCRSKRLVLHELGHAMGLYHEQSRPDRDNYVTIHYDNVEDGQDDQFQIMSWIYLINLGIPYDYDSIMHYSKTEFSKNGKITVETKDPTYQDTIGKKEKLSFGDIKTMNLMYNCHEETPDCQLTASDCNNEGFVGKDCTCWCPGNPVQQC